MFTALRGKVWQPRFCFPKIKNYGSNKHGYNRRVQLCLKKCSHIQRELRGIQDRVANPESGQILHVFAERICSQIHSAWGPIHSPWLGGLSQLWHRVIVPTCQPVRQPYAIFSFIPPVRDYELGLRSLELGPYGVKFSAVRSLSISSFIEKEPHKQLRMKRKRRGER